MTKTPTGADGFSIRPATPDDADAAARVLSRAFAGSGATFPDSANISAAEFNLLMQTGRAFLVALVGQEPKEIVVGVVRYWDEEGIAEFDMHAVEDLAALENQLAPVHAELGEILVKLERHFRDMCDVEFTVSDGRLFILQTRIGRRSPLAAARIAVAMAEDPEFPLTKAEAVARVDLATLQQIASAGAITPDATPVGHGLAASPGVGVGVLCCDPDKAADLAADGTATVLAREETSPADIHGMVGADGLVTTLGGMASHAAVVARSWAIPAVTSLVDARIVGEGLLVGGTLLREGETVTIDGQTGAIYAGDRRAGGDVDLEETRTLRQWATELGVDPGTSAGDQFEPEQMADVTLLELARTVQLKGLCTPERAAAALFTAKGRIEKLAEGNTHLFKETPRGFVLTVEGRDWVTENIAVEAGAVNGDAFNDCYLRFLPLNIRLKQIVSAWQATSGSDRRDEAWSEAVDSVEQLQADLHSLVEETAGHVERLQPYNRRFEAAIDAMRAGDESMLASPLKDSYHTVWFEYHEELIVLSGRDRATEEGS